ncbi:hypothetical protein EK904_015071 [Melospiza melodia maxima]|nr:hypothetical protein EK904_015071 [Melospiza melodia maxima]
MVDTKTSSEKGSLLYPYGPDQGDETNPKLDDGTSEAITLSIPFTFYGKTHQTAFVGHPKFNILGNFLHFSKFPLHFH